MADGAKSAAQQNTAQAARESDAGTATAAGRYHDPVLAAALATPDLAAAVQYIMDHGEEDHCADTRLMLLVELLPADRLAEVGAALEKHGGNDYIVRFLMQAWAQRDAAGALAWVESAGSSSSTATQALITGWVRADPAAAGTGPLTPLAESASI